jgi:hypothetical protein
MSIKSQSLVSQESTAIRDRSCGSGAPDQGRSYGHWLRWAAAAMITVCGCGKSGPAVAKVGGKVIYQGQPVARATVTFTPTSPGAPPGIGATDDNGHYYLGTYSARDGAVIGGHKVSIVARAPYKGAVPQGAGAAYLEELQERGNPLIPQRYFHADTSGLIAEVKPGSNTMDFVLNEKAP